MDVGRRSGRSCPTPTGVVFRYVHEVDRIGELAHAGQVGEVEVGHVDITGNRRRDSLALGDRPASNDHPVLKREIANAQSMVPAVVPYMHGKDDGLLAE